MSKTIVIIHGMWGRGFLLSNFSQYFEDKGFNCITPDLPGHSSDKEEQKKIAGYGFDDFVNYMAKEIEKLDEKPIVIGHSMGGLIAHKLAEMGLVEKAVLVTPATQSNIFNICIGSFLSFLPLLFKPYFWKQPIVPSKKGFDFSCPEVPENLRAKYFKNLVPESGKAFFQIGFWGLDSKNTTQIDNTKIEVPIFQVGCKNDRMIALCALKSQARILKRDLKDFRFKIYKESGHGIVWEDRWIELADDIYKWIKNS